MYDICEFLRLDQSNLYSDKIQWQTAEKEAMFKRLIIHNFLGDE